MHEAWRNSRSSFSPLLFDNRVVAQIISISKDGLGSLKERDCLMASCVQRFNLGGVAGKKCKDFLGQSKEFKEPLEFYSFPCFSLGFLF